MADLTKTEKKRIRHAIVRHGLSHRGCRRNCRGMNGYDMIERIIDERLQQQQPNLGLMCQACGGVFDDMQIAFKHAKEHAHMTNNSGDAYGFILGTEEALM